jgi:hypothetical protein
MKYPSATFRRHIGPKLLGTYEKELHPVWATVAEQSYSQIIDVGCAEGYYAVGLARIFPATLVHAFDTDYWARNAAKKMAVINGADNIQIHGACTVEWLDHNLCPGAFILSDCEGYETILLEPMCVPKLLECTVLVEAHDVYIPGVTEILQERFLQTHSCEVITAQQRSALDIPSSIDYLSPEEARLAVDEFRPPNHRWLLFTPRP